MGMVGVRTLQVSSEPRFLDLMTEAIDGRVGPVVDLGPDPNHPGCTLYKILVRADSRGLLDTDRVMRIDRARDDG